MNKTRHKVIEARKREIDDYRDALTAFEAKEDQVSDLLIDGTLDPDTYKRQIERIRDERTHFTDQLERVNRDIDDAYLETAESILELATQAKLLWESRSPLKRRSLIETVLSNPVLDGKTIRFDWKIPFAALAEMNKDGGWCSQPRTAGFIRFAAQYHIRANFVGAPNPALRGH